MTTEKYNVNSFIGIVVLITVCDILEQILVPKLVWTQTWQMTSWICKINVRSPGHTSFILFLIGENYFYVLYLFYLFVFFYLIEDFIFKQNCLVTVHFFIFLYSQTPLFIGV